MKRIGIVLLTAGMTLAALATSASASSHGAPVFRSLFGRVLFEFEHFLIHIQLTTDALLLMFAAPSLGWTMLTAQTLCANVTPFVGLLFGTAGGAVVSFAVTVLLGIMFFTWVVRGIWSFCRSPRLALAA